MPDFPNNMNLCVRKEETFWSAQQLSHLVCLFRKGISYRMQKSRSSFHSEITGGSCREIPPVTELPLVIQSCCFCPLFKISSLSHGCNSRYQFTSYISLDEHYASSGSHRASKIRGKRQSTKSFLRE